MKAQYCFGCMNELAGQVERCPYCHTVLPYRMQDPNDLPAGMILKKRYLVGRSLGRGGFGATYIARDLKTDKVLTIKEYFPEFACLRNPGSNFVACRPGTEEKFLSYQKEFKTEVQHLKMVRDIPGVVQFYDYFEAFGTSYLVMNYLDGKTLKDTQIGLHRPFTVQESVDYILYTLQVLSRVHSKKILHRDISPDNIFITSSGQIYLIDFGSSILMSQATMTGFTKGVYTAPEQRINGAQSPATDLYAVGVTLFTLLNNHKPKEVEGIHLEEMPDTIPQAIRDVYTKATQREMSQRFQSADEMAKALSLASGVPLPSVPSNRKKKLKNLLVAMMALVAVLLAVVMMAVSGGTKSPAPTATPLTATVTPVVTEAPAFTPVPTMTEDFWLCRMSNQLYRISAQGMEQITEGAFPALERQLQAVEIQGLRSEKQIYDLDAFEIVHTGTGQSFALTSETDSTVLWLLPGEYALRVTKGDHYLAESFTVPVHGPVALSGSSKGVMAEWWNAQFAEATVATQTPVVTQTPVACVHEWQEQVLKEPTCMARGEMVQRCSICGEEGEHQRIPAIGHEMKDATCTESAICVRCGVKDTAHQPPLGHDMTAATCTEAAICKRCGEVDAEHPALGHDWQNATCTMPQTCTRCNVTQGSIAGHTWAEASCTAPSTCTVCGEKSGSAAGHVWGEWHSKTAATCTLGGSEERFCGNCGQKETRNTGALGHNMTAASCTAPSTCTVCGEKSGSAAGHVWGEWHSKTAATCTLGGSEERFCGNCGQKETRNTSVLGHVPGSEATCTTAQKCTRCNAVLQNAKGHAFGTWHSKTAATCTTGGVEERICGDCGTRETRNISAPGHAYGSWNIIQEATCTNTQISRRICGNCGEQDWQYGTETKKHAYFNGSCLWCGMAEPGVVLPRPGQ